MNHRLYAQNGEVFEAIDIIGDETRINISYKGQTFSVDFTEITPGQFSALIDGHSHVFSATRVDSETIEISTTLGTSAFKILSERQKLEAELFGFGSSEAGAGELKAPMPGLILRVEVSEGDHVSKGQPLLIMEAMKMENEIKSPIDGTISKITIATQTAVEKDDLLLVITGD